MNRGKILKVRPGHDANCSAMAYMGGVLVGFLGYALLFGIMVFVQLRLETGRLGSKLVLMALWFIPLVLALAAFLTWAYTSGAMAYGSAVCVFPVALVMLIGMVVGWTMLS